MLAIGDVVKMTTAPFTIENRCYTAEELFRFPREARFELVQGKLLPMSPTSGDHAFTTADLMLEIGSFVRREGLGRCTAAEAGFLLARNPDVVLAPDLAFISTARLAGHDSRAYLELATDLVVETRSPGDRRSEIARKVKRWRDYGVTVAIDADPKRHTLTVHRLDASPIVLEVTETLTLPDLLPGFEMPLTSVFSVQSNLITSG